MTIPQQFEDVVCDCVKRNPNNVNQAIDECLTEFRSLDGFDKLIDSLLRQAISDLVYKQRHKSNVEMKKVARYYGQGAKVKDIGDGVKKAAKTWYDSYYIGGKVIGDLTGADIKAIIVHQRKMIAGHTVNLQLLQWLDGKGIPENAKVRDVVKLDEALRTFAQIETDIKEEMAGVQ